MTTSVSYKWPAEEGAREHEHGAEGEEPPEEEEEEPLVVAAVHVQRVRGVAPLDQRALREEYDLQTVGISLRENVLALYSVLTTLFPRVNSLEFGHIVNLGLLELSWASFMMLVLVLSSRLRKSGFFLQTSASIRLMKNNLALRESYSIRGAQVSVNLNTDLGNVTSNSFIKCSYFRECDHL